MKVLQSKHDLCGVEASSFVAEANGLAQMREHLPADDILKHHVEAALVLECTTTDTSDKDNELEYSLTMKG